MNLRISFIREQKLSLANIDTRSRPLAETRYVHEIRNNARDL